jgi:hypothetical protein
MKKFIIFILLLLISFLAFKFYLLHEIGISIKETNDGQYLASQTLSLPIVQETGKHEVITKNLQFNTYVNLTRFEEENPESGKDKYLFSWEKGDLYKAVLITDTSNSTGIIEKLTGNDSIKNINKMFKQEFKADFDLLSSCFSLSHEDLNIFTSIENLNLYPICFPLRAMFIHYKKGIYIFELTKDIKILQIGDPEYGKVSMYFYDSKKQVLSILFYDFNQQDIDLFLNTVKVL